MKLEALLTSFLKTKGSKALLQKLGKKLGLDDDDLEALMTKGPKEGMADLVEKYGSRKINQLLGRRTDAEGDVVDITVSHFTIMEMGNWIDADDHTGRLIHVPNGKVFIESLANYGKGFHFIWNEMPVLITFESNWKKAKKILEKIIKIKSEKFHFNASEMIKKASKKIKEA